MWMMMMMMIVMMMITGCYDPLAAILKLKSK
jgi:hypothetical protein